MANVVPGAGLQGPTESQLNQQQMAQFGQMMGQGVVGLENSRQFNVQNQFNVMSSMVNQSYGGDWARFMDDNPELGKTFLDQVSPFGADVDKIYDDLRTGARTMPQYQKLLQDQILAGNITFADIGPNEPEQSTGIPMLQTKAETPTGPKETINIPEKFTGEREVQKSVKEEVGPLLDFAPPPRRIASPGGSIPKARPDELAINAFEKALGDKRRELGRDVTPQEMHELILQHPVIKEKFSFEREGEQIEKMVTEVQKFERAPTLGDAAYSLYKQRTGKTTPDYQSEEWVKAATDAANALGIKDFKAKGWDNQKIDPGEIKIGGQTGQRQLPKQTRVQQVSAQLPEVTKTINAEEAKVMFTPKEQLTSGKEKAQQRTGLNKYKRWVATEQGKGRFATGNLTNDDLALALNIAGGALPTVTGDLQGATLGPEENPFTTALFSAAQGDPKTAAEIMKIQAQTAKYITDAAVNEQLMQLRANKDQREAYAAQLSAEQLRKNASSLTPANKLAFQELSETIKTAQDAIRETYTDKNGKLNQKKYDVAWNRWRAENKSQWDTYATMLGSLMVPPGAPPALTAAEKVTKLGWFGTEADFATLLEPGFEFDLGAGEGAQAQAQSDADALGSDLGIDF